MANRESVFSSRSLDAYPHTAFPLFFVHPLLSKIRLASHGCKGMIPLFSIMMDTAKALIRSLIVHRVGNKLREEGIFISKQVQPMTQELQEILLNSLLPPLQENPVQHFTHSSDHALNEMFAFATSIFKKPDSFLPICASTLKHLYVNCDHPKIKGGEVCFVHFDKVSFDGHTTQAWGIFLSERKDTFLRVDQTKDQLGIRVFRGIPTKRLDKGCLVINTESEDAYRVLSFDTNTDETRFWHEKFLGVTPVLDDRFLTESCLSMCRQFAEKHFTGDESKKEQILAVQKTLHYFSNNETFDSDNFAAQVFQDAPTASEFKEFKKDFDKQHDILGRSSFAISSPAVKKAKRAFKRSIHLDTKIEVKLNFNDPATQSEFVQRGYDSKRRMFFYKLYFNKEN